MKPSIKMLAEKKMVGLSLTMSILENKTGLLWGEFGPRIQEIKNRLSPDRISLQLYPDDYFISFNPTTKFEKWALVEVQDFENIPKDMKSFTLEEGLYAVFDYKGSSSDNTIFQYIYNDWLPNSSYQLDHRPHFEVLGANYRNNDAESEEEIWIPVKAMTDN